ncbi:hypothetical protein ACROYT_G016934 [Oculina patagonica]
MDENKASLVNFLCTETSQSYHGHSRKELVLSGGFTDPKKVWSSTDRHLAGLASDHEEADTRILLHARDATIRGYQQINVVCRDTDVLVLLAAHLPELSPSVWMFTGTAKRKLYVPLHRIRLSEENRSSLLAFHAITGCDTTGQFAGIGKQSAWSIFVTYSELLQHLGREECPDDKVLSDAEAFVCKLYNRGTTEVLINKPCPVLPNPDGSGWHYNEDGILKPKLVTLEQVSEGCLQLVYCGCTREGNCCATRRCTCFRLSLNCSRACKCGDLCRNITVLD